MNKSSNMNDIVDERGISTPVDKSSTASDQSTPTQMKHAHAIVTRLHECETLMHHDEHDDDIELLIKYDDLQRQLDIMKQKLAKRGKQLEEQHFMATGASSSSFHDRSPRASAAFETSDEVHHDKEPCEAPSGSGHVAMRAT